MQTAQSADKPQTSSKTQFRLPNPRQIPMEFQVFLKNFQDF